jgi:hypothetical protein
MRSNWKRRLRNVAGLASLLNGFWAFQMQAGAENPDWVPVATAGLSAWACYFSLVWIVEGMRSGR